MGDWKEYIIHVIWAFAFAIIAAIVYENYHNIIILLSICFLAIAALIIIEFYRRRKEKIGALNKIYSFIGKSSVLKPEDLIGKKRPFKPYYYHRQVDDSIDECLINKKNVLIIGSPLAGKTRALFQALNKLNKPQGIAIPICKDINPETFTLPKNTKIIVIDDLHRFVEQQNFDHLFSISTCKTAFFPFLCDNSIKI
jgi:hypothetical protein